MSAPSLPQFVAVGEALTDMMRVGQSDQWHARTGGSTWNVARAAAAFGLSSAFAGAISTDCFGDDLWRDSEAAGLDLRFLQRVGRSPLLAMVPQANPPRYFFIGDNSADLYFDAEALPAGWSSAASWVHFGGISLAREPLAQRLVALAGDLHAAGVRVSYDPNYRNLMGPAYRPTFERMCRVASAIKLSDEDLAGLMPGRDVQAALAEVRTWNTQAWWLYTEGAAGARLLTPDGAWRATPPPIDLIDTVGAGDAAIAGLIASCVLRPAASGGDHLAFAVAAGSGACMSSGAKAPAMPVLLPLLERVTVQVDAQG